MIIPLAVVLRSFFKKTDRPPAACAAGTGSARAARRWPAWLAGLSLPLLAIVSSHVLLAGEETISPGHPRSFTLNEAVETALRQNPDILRALQEIERTKGLLVEVRAQALPRLDATAVFRQTDPNLTDFGSGFAVTGGGGGVTPTPMPTATPMDGASFTSFGTTDNSYNLAFEVTQLVYSGSVFPAIRAANFTRDIAYYQLRDVVDTVISNVRQQFYLVLLNKALIEVQDESIRLLNSQLRDQQNRFEAGTVPRFNVLRAEVELSNQRPELIRARNNYRITQLQLAKTLGLDFDPARGDGDPLRVVGSLDYEPRNIPLTVAIEMGKERRTFLKQQRANMLTQKEQVRIAAAGYHPTIRLNGGYEFQSSPFSDNVRDAQGGYTVGAVGEWAIWDSGATYGRIKQAKAVYEQARITLEDAVRQVELEIQQAYSSMQQNRELIGSQAKNVEQAQESLRLAGARLDAGAGTQLEVLDARVALTRSQSTRLQALYDYNAAVAEFDRVTASDTVYVAPFVDPADRRRRGRAPVARSSTRRRPPRQRPPPARPGRPAIPNSRGPGARGAPFPLNDVPLEFFPALQVLPVRHAFVRRVPGLDVAHDKEEALRRLDQVHFSVRQLLAGLRYPFLMAEQVHGNDVAVIREKPDEDHCFADCDALVTDLPEVWLGIHVADCGAVYLVDPRRQVIGLAHSGRKGTELNIVGRTIAAMHDHFGTDPADLVVQLGPCIRPPHYEVDFAAEIIRQSREAGVQQVHDCGLCTACDLEKYYSYRLEKGKTGRMLALLALGVAEVAPFAPAEG